jgi:hypothetical protein
MDLFAYLDPGSGSMLLQMLLGGIAGIAVSIKMFGKRIFGALAFWKKDEEEPEPEVSATESEVSAATPEAESSERAKETV